MKAATSPIPILRPLSSFLLLPLKNPWNLSTIHHSSSSSSLSLTAEELTQVNLLIPRLCQSNNLPHAIRLLDACLLIHPLLPNLTALIDRLTDEPDLTQPMSLLTRLTRNSHARPHLLSISRMLAFSYFDKQRPKEAMKVFNWMLRPNSPCVIDESTYRGFVLGFCRNGWTLEALKALRKMVGEEMVPREDLRECIFKSLLREARVREAMEIDAALDCIREGERESQAAAELIDGMVCGWRD
ncbi:hypothetical protein MRB53_023786 [Persea americana]|uniref:Uncharacterized protein n=1 Tax=Persea americana TaxID=3435 RepID=A0ACC2LBL4_PERAE|nr:hypothetical protein MRB53_023786 [Persea americana]|eukprot:TRINITY_DN5715_c0_g3_i2.p1 TRINITY_DN5715_c0_g3~~TRINITY_DN5715_c0_g3_i2.p1  ORF type:complete len:242 (+),score=40.61 TRINITY_DN5715_c0_g3_i2:155-880(+)